jgi:hypothetical protein
MKDTLLEVLTFLLDHAATHATGDRAVKALTLKDALLAEYEAFAGPRNALKELPPETPSADPADSGEDGGIAQTGEARGADPIGVPGEATR